MFYTYIYRRPNGEPIYVGKGTGRRAKSHLTRKDRHPLTQCLNKMKRDGQDPIVEILPQKTERMAFLLEAFLISDFGRRIDDTGTLTNLTKGGEGSAGYKHSADALARMSASHTGVKRAPFSAEHRAKIGLVQKDSKAVAEGRIKQAEKMKGRKEDPVAKAKRAKAISAGHQRRRERLAQAGA